MSQTNAAQDRLANSRLIASGSAHRTHSCSVACLTRSLFFFQGGSRVSAAAPKKTRSGDALVDGATPSPSSSTLPDNKRSAASDDDDDDHDDDGSLTEMSSEGGLIAGDETVATISGYDAASASSASSADAEDGGVVSPASTGKDSCCTHRGADLFIAEQSEHRAVNGDAHGGLGTAAASEQCVVVAGGGDGGLVTPTSSSADTTLVAGGVGDVLGFASPPPNGSSVDHSDHDAGEAPAVEEHGLTEDCASEGSLFTGGRDSTDMFSRGEPDQVSGGLSPAVTEQHQVLATSPPLHRAVAVADASAASHEAMGGEETGKDAAKGRSPGTAPARMASAWLGGEKWNMAASAGPSLPPQFRALRLWTKPPKGWEYGPEGRWVPEKPPTPAPAPPTRSSRRQQPPLLRKAGVVEDGWWGSGSRPLV